eukprot:scaffold8351_cov93-Skeletonema_dohrnii-CCMP3373.AAC.14
MPCEASPGQRKKRSKSKVSSASDPGSFGQTPFESEGRSELACLYFCCAACVDALSQFQLT